jgi:hypothetical protein
LSSLEEYYFDSAYRLRARGFIYDEETGIFLNDYGLLEYKKPVLEKGQEAVREIFNFTVEVSIEPLVEEILEPEIIAEAVA